MRENIIQLKLPVDEVVEKLNAVVRTRVKFIDQWGKSNYLFWGEKIEKNEFEWDYAKYVNGLHRIKGTVVDRGNGNTEVHIKLKNRIPPCCIYILSIIILLIGMIAKEFFSILFAFIFIVVYWITKQNYLDMVTTEIKNVFKGE